MSNEDTIARLKAARDILAAPGGWVKGIGYPDGATCALGALGRAYDFKEDPEDVDNRRWWDTDSIIQWLLEVDGDAIMALGRLTPHGEDQEEVIRKSYEDYPLDNGVERAVLEALATEIFQFNDAQIFVEPVLKLYDDAIASLS